MKKTLFLPILLFLGGIVSYTIAHRTISDEVVWKNTNRTTLGRIMTDLPSMGYFSGKGISQTTQKPDTGLPSAVLQRKQYQVIGKVLSIELEKRKRNVCLKNGKTTIVKIEVTSSMTEGIHQNDTLYCELVQKPRIHPVVGREYVFQSDKMNRSHAKGIYMFAVDIMDLVY